MNWITPGRIELYLNSQFLEFIKFALQFLGIEQCDKADEQAWHENDTHDIL